MHTQGVLEASGRSASEDLSLCVKLRVIGINCLTLGCELCGCAAFVYIPPMLLKMGFSEERMSVVMGIGPFISLLLVSLIGAWSDNCQSRLGRRLPFILVLGAVTIFSLVLISQCDRFGLYTNPGIVVAIGAVLLDFATQALFNPCKALISDVLTTPAERDFGYTAYSCMMSLGGCLAYLITSIDWKAYVGPTVGSQEKAVFHVLMIMFFVFLLINLFVGRDEARAKSKLSPHQSSESLNVEMVENGSVTTKSGEASVMFSNNNSVPLKRAKYANGVTVHTSATAKETSDFRTPPKISQMPCFNLCLVPCLVCDVSVVSIVISVWKRICSIVMWPLATLTDAFHLRGIFSMPKIVLLLFVNNVLTWMAVMCHNLYYTDFIGQVIYHGNPQGEELGVERRLYDEGVRMGAWGLLLHSITGTVYAAFMQNKLIDMFGQQAAYIFGMVVFTISMVATLVTNNITVVNVFAALSGLGSSVVSCIPYCILSTYNSSQKKYYTDVKENRGIGEDMAVLDAAYYLSQIIPSLFAGYLVELSQSIATYMAVAAVCGALSCLSSLFLFFPTNDI